ncbi:hypothetical protein [Bacillus coahuilensis]|uniref:capsular polysaccharide export protein, LipB/KpsS family n=1 Tax=Bacillus coahuilensis TaxID=408580 RepID=UPI0007503156|nr:hypothetical protein [Bacillus coahuilensis]
MLGKDLGSFPFSSAIIDRKGSFHIQNTESEMKDYLKDNLSSEEKAKAEYWIQKLYGDNRENKRTEIGIIDFSLDRESEINIALVNELVNSIQMEHSDTIPVIFSNTRDSIYTKYFTKSKVVTIGNKFTNDIYSNIKHLYTINSKFALPAIFMDIKVTCVGNPFYSGYGLTNDLHTICKPTKCISKYELFATLFFRCSVYLHDTSGIRISFEEYMNMQSTYKKDLAYVFNIQEWKKGFLQPFLIHKYKHIKFINDPKEIDNLEAGNFDLVVWGLKENKELKLFAKRNNKTIVRIEDGFVRSVGLGTNVTKAWSLAIDEIGIYFNPKQTSKLEKILNETVFPKSILQKATELMIKLNQNNITKYNCDPVLALNIDTYDKRVILVPGQVEDDASIITGTKSIRTNLDLLSAVREENPDAFIIYKPHPDVVSKNRSGIVTSDFISGLSDHIEMKASVISCLMLADEVHTMTSLTGFDGLIRGKKVVTYGSPFYSGWGLTNDKLEVSRRNRVLTLEELVAGSLLYYPIYYDWSEKVFANGLTITDYIIEKKSKIDHNKGIQVKFIISKSNKIKKIYYLLTYKLFMKRG